MPDRIDIGLPYPLPFGYFRIEELAVVDDAGIVDEQCHRPEYGFGLVECGGEGFGLRDIERQRVSPADLLRQRFDAVLAPRRQHDRGAMRRQHLGEAGAKTGRGPGDQSHLALEVKQVTGQCDEGHEIGLS